VPRDSLAAWLRRDIGRATLLTASVGGLFLIEFFALRPLQQLGVLDRSAAVLNALIYLAGAPGMALARAMRLDKHLSSPSFLAASMLLSLSMIWLLGLLLFRARRQRRERAATAAAAAPGRRRLLARAASSAILGGLAIAGGYAVLWEPRWVRVRRLRLGVRDLPRSLVGLKLIQLSDLHHGPFNAAADLRRVMRRCNELGADLVLLTGDYVHASPRYIAPVARLLGELRPRLGILGVLGNHDHWESATLCRQALRSVGVRMIENSRVFVTAAGLSDVPGRESLCIAGVGDYWEDHPDLCSALRGVDPRTPRLVLSHNPDFAESASFRRCDPRVDLLLAGHTHGGQVRLPVLGRPIIPSSYGQKYAAGLVRGPRCPVYVSTGLGVTILPLRFGVRPEITLLELVGDRG
jgi:uncharacterized protein